MLTLLWVKATRKQLCFQVVGSNSCCSVSCATRGGCVSDSETLGQSGCCHFHIWGAVTIPELNTTLKCLVFSFFHRLDSLGSVMCNHDVLFTAFHHILPCEIQLMEKRSVQCVFKQVCGLQSCSKCLASLFKSEAYTDFRFWTEILIIAHALTGANFETT